jgi:hypothetical protein
MDFAGIVVRILVEEPDPSLETPEFWTSSAIDFASHRPDLRHGSNVIDGEKSV